MLGMVGLFSACALMALSTFFGNPVIAVLSLALASFCNDITLPGAWASSMDIGGSFAGTLSGTMNMMGNLGGALASWAAPHILLAAHDDWNAVIYVAAGIYFIGIFFWMGLDTVTPITHERIA
jgi:MFS transporter, ACS family, glucarate transporter